jgi:hypothetical protein
LIGLTTLICAAVWAQSSQPTATKGPAGSDYTATAEGIVAELYKSVSYEANQATDWEKVRGLFVREAVVVLRATREKMSVFSVDGFIDDFVKFNEKSGAGHKGFTERVVKMKPLVFGDIAHVLVLYEAQITGSERPPQRGVDSFELVRKDDRWWITSINNEICTPQRPAPRELQD